MRNKLNLKNKKVVVVGLARSGIASAILLKNIGAKVFVSDIKDDADTRSNKEQLRREQIEAELGGHSRECFENADLIVTSPGVRFDAECLNWARSKNIPVISEIELGFRLCPAEIIAITGSNGKSTTTALIGEVIKLTGKKTHVCGNIGRPFCGEIEKIAKGDFVILEVSSFQLEAVVDFKPKVAVILNFNRNHLDRHKDLEEYLTAKKRIFANQDKSDWTVLNRDDVAVKSLAQEASAQIKFFNSSININGLTLDANQSAALTVGEIFGLNRKDILKVISSFRGLPHRREFVDTVRGVDFINDSKATTVEACRWALNNIYKPVILIAGGRDKGLDFKEIRDLVRRRVKTLIVIGEAKEKLKKAYIGVTPIIEADNLRQALVTAGGVSCEGDCVLLSPMCASFDMFSDYEERGEVFKEIVRELKKTESREILENTKH